MRLTSFIDYGLRALMRIASDPAPEVVSAELADEFDISRHHLTKIIQRLSQAGVVTTRRGGGGGATLAKPANKIRLGDVVRWLEEDQALVDCFMPGGGICTIRVCYQLEVTPACSGTFIHRKSQHIDTRGRRTSGARHGRLLIRASFIGR